MGFVNEEASICKMNDLQKKEWEYLNELGIRTMFGDPIGPSWCDLVVDREKNYYFIAQGHTNPNRDGRKIYYYALCLDGKILNMEVTKKESENMREKLYECHCKIEKIEFPTGWTFDKVGKGELLTIIREALMTELDSMYISEISKVLTVEMSEPYEANEGEAERW